MPQHSKASIVMGSPPALEVALADEVAAAQWEDPLAPVGVLLGGTLQRPYLQRRLAELNDGIVNVRFVMPSEFALELGERAMIEAGQGPPPPPPGRLPPRGIAVGPEGYLQPVRQ